MGRAKDQAQSAAKKTAKKAGKKAVLSALAANPPVAIALGLVAFLTVLIVVTLLLISSTAVSAATQCNTDLEGTGSSTLDSPGGGKWVGASQFGGSSDPSTGHTGYRGDNLNNHPNSFAELSNNYSASINDLDFAALGKLPHNAALRVTGPKGSLVLRKRDVGAGGPPVGAPPTKRAIDIWYVAAKRLGINGTGRVRVERVSGSAGEDDATGSATTGPDTKIKFPLPLAATPRPESTYGRASSVKGTKFLEGDELYAASGTPVAAPVSGKVARAGWIDDYGYFVAIERAEVTYVLARLRKAPSAAKGSRVTAGEVVGEVGRTGGAKRGDTLSSTKPHLEVRMYDPQHVLGGNVRPSGAIDPTDYLQAAYDGSGADADTLDAAGDCTGDQVPEGGDRSVEAIVKWADWVEAKRFPYCWGGGHVDPARPSGGSYCWTASNVKNFGDPGPGLDCSSAISYVFQHAGFKLPTMVSSGFTGWGDPGPGKRVTIYSNPGHVFMVIDGKTWQTSATNYRHGPGWTPPRSDLGDYAMSHPPGL